MFSMSGRPAAWKKVCACANDTLILVSLMWGRKEGEESRSNKNTEFKEGDKNEFLLVGWVD